MKARWACLARDRIDHVLKSASQRPDIGHAPIEEPAMTRDRAERLRQSIPSTPAVAEAVVARLSLIEPCGAFPIDFSRKAPAIRAALHMVIANVDIAGDVRETLTRSSDPVVGDLKNETLAARIRREMLEAIRDSAAEWDDQLEDDWTDVVETVTGAMFAAAA
jgi:hypothetical protein